MIPNNSGSYLLTKQEDLYEQFNSFASSHPLLGKLTSPLLAAADVTLETLKFPAVAIEGVALTIINLIGMIFSEDCTLEDAVISLRTAILNIGATPGAILFIPIHFIFQTYAIAIDPSHVSSADLWSQ